MRLPILLTAVALALAACTPPAEAPADKAADPAMAAQEPMMPADAPPQEDAVAPTEDANIGAGLAAFGAVIMVSVGWAFVDALRHGFGWALRAWAIAAAIPAVGLWVWLAITEADASMSVGEILRNDVGTVPMIYAFSLTGALVGAGLGEAVRPLPRS